MEGTGTPLEVQITEQNSGSSVEINGKEDEDTDAIGAFVKLEASLDEILLIEAGILEKAEEPGTEGEVGGTLVTENGDNAGAASDLEGVDMAGVELQTEPVPSIIGNSEDVTEVLGDAPDTVCPPPVDFQDDAVGFSATSEASGTDAEMPEPLSHQNVDLDFEFSDKADVLDSDKIFSVCDEIDAEDNSVSVNLLDGFEKTEQNDTNFSDGQEPSVNLNGIGPTSVVDGPTPTSIVEIVPESSKTFNADEKDHTVEAEIQPPDVPQSPNFESVPVPQNADVGIAIHFTAKDEVCHIITDAPVAAAADERKDEQDEDRMNPEEEEAAIQFLKLQEQKKQEDDFDDDFDVQDLPSKSDVVPQTQPTISPKPAVGVEIDSIGKTMVQSKILSQSQPESSVGSKTAVGDQGAASAEIRSAADGSRSVFYTGKEVQEDSFGGSVFYTGVEAGGQGGNGDGPSAAAAAEKSEVNVSLSEKRKQGYAIKDDGVKSEAHQAAEAAWDAVETITPGMGHPDDLLLQPPSKKTLAQQHTQDHGQQEDSDSDFDDAHVKTTPVITYQEALEAIKTGNMARYRAQIRQTVQRGVWGSFKHIVFGPPKLQKNLIQEKEMIFLIAACPFDNREESHFRILQTIYKKLTGSKFDCQRYGNHWEHVGFQGTDPSTDLRAAGLLGLLNILYLLTSPKLWSLAMDIYKLSLHETQNFPFCVMSINMTRIALQTLREESLNKECNKRQNVIDLFNDIYVGSYFHMYRIWKQGHKTIKDSGYIIRDLETLARKSPKTLMKNLETYLSEKESGKVGILEDCKDLDFSGVCDLGGKDEDGDLV